MLHGGQTHTLLLGEARQALSLPGCPALPTVLNPGGRGFYRVAYPAQQQHALGRALATLPATAQATLLSDTFALAQAGELTLADWLALLPGVPELRGAGRAAIFDQVRRQSELLRTTFQGTPAAAPLDELARALFAPALAALGWDPAPGEADEDARLRDALIGALARHGDADVIRRARILFDDDEAGRAALPAGIRTGVFEAVALGGDAARFAQLVARLKAAPAEEERWRLAAVLALTPDPLLARRVLDLSLDGEVPSQIGTQLPGMLAGAQPVHGERAYPFVLENWARLAERAGPMFAAREWLLPAAAGGFSTPAAAAMLRADQQRLAGAPGESPAARVAAGIELRAAIRARELERLPESLRSAVRSLGTARAASPA
jgi:aminopeptidase N